MNKDGDIVATFNGGIQLNTQGKERPECNSDIRGTVWYGQAGEGGSEDHVEVCKMMSPNNFEWKNLN